MEDIAPRIALRRPWATIAGIALLIFAPTIVAGQSIQFNATASTALDALFIGRTGSCAATIPAGTDISQGYVLRYPGGFTCLAASPSELTVSPGANPRFGLRERVGASSRSQEIVGSHNRTITMCSPTSSVRGQVEVTVLQNAQFVLFGGAGADVTLTSGGVVIHSQVIQAPGAIQRTYRFSATIGPSTPLTFDLRTRAFACGSGTFGGASADIGVAVEFITDRNCASTVTGPGCGQAVLYSYRDPINPGNDVLQLQAPRFVGSPGSAVLVLGLQGRNTALGPHQVTGKPCVMWNDALAYIPWAVDPSGRAIAAFPSAPLRGVTLHAQAGTLNAAGVVSITRGLMLACP